MLDRKLFFRSIKLHRSASVCPFVPVCDQPSTQRLSPLSASSGNQTDKSKEYCVQLEILAIESVLHAPWPWKQQGESKSGGNCFRRSTFLL